MALKAPRESQANLVIRADDEIGKGQSQLCGANKSRRHVYALPATAVPLRLRPLSASACRGHALPAAHTRPVPGNWHRRRSRAWRTPQSPSLDSRSRVSRGTDVINGGDKSKSGTPSPVSEIRLRRTTRDDRAPMPGTNQKRGRRDWPAKRWLRGTSWGTDPLNAAKNQNGTPRWPGRTLVRGTSWEPTVTMRRQTKEDAKPVSRRRLRRIHWRSAERQPGKVASDSPLLLNRAPRCPPWTRPETVVDKVQDNFFESDQTMRVRWRTKRSLLRELSLRIRAKTPPGGNLQKCRPVIGRTVDRKHPGKSSPTLAATLSRTGPLISASARGC